jgi:hypothetical protein
MNNLTVKDIITIFNKYREKYKGRIVQGHKDYYKKHKDKILRQQRERYYKNKKIKNVLPLL